MKQTIYEEIQRMNLLSRYDNSKTLSEQAIPGGISQQAFDKIMTISKQNKKGFRGSYLFPAQQTEINNEFGADTYSKFFYNGGEAMLMKPVEKPVEKPATTPVRATAIPGGISRQAFDKIMAISARNRKNLSGSYLFPAQQTEINNEFGADTYTKFYKNGGEAMLMKPETAPLATTTSANSKESLDYYAGEADKAMAKYKTAAVGAAAKTTQAPKTTITVPKELDSVTKIQAFQQWLDDNHGDAQEGSGNGWAKSYTGGIINKGQNGGGFGKFGPRTSAAWDKYKTAYLTPAAAAPATQMAPGPDDDVPQQ
jgi:hypothetical protein